MSDWRVRSARHEDRNDVQPEVEILAERTRLDSGRQILVRRGQNAHVHADSLGAADRLHDLLLQRTQHLGLRLQTHVADLVEEDRPAVGRLELALPVRDRASEGAPHVSEELRLDQFFGDGRAVHFDERTLPAPAHRVNGSRDELLAGPVLAVDEHAAVGRRRHGDLLAQLDHRMAVADHRELPVDVGPQRAILRFEMPLAKRVPHDEDGLLERERLFDEIERAHLDRANGGLDVSVARDQHDLRVGLALPQALQRREAIDARQPDIEDDEVVRAPRQAVRDRSRRSRPFRRRSPRRAARRQGRERTPGSSSTISTVCFITLSHARYGTRTPHSAIRNPNSGLPLHAGSSIVNRAPCGTFSPTSILPRCSPRSVARWPGRARCRAAWSSSTA